MSKELVSVASLTNLPSNDVADLEEYKVTKWTPRIQLFGSNKEVKQGLIAPGHWGVPGKDAVEDLGKEVDVLVIGHRFKALDTNGDDNVECFDRADPVYQEIKETASVYVPGGSGCMEGPEFLLYVRGFGFATYFCMNKSAQICSTQLRPFLPINDAQVAKMNAKGKEVKAQGPQTVTLGGKYIEKKQISYWAPEAVKCSTMVECDTVELVTELTKFLNPKTKEVEADKDDR